MKPRTVHTSVLVVVAVAAMAVMLLVGWSYRVKQQSLALQGLEDEEPGGFPEMPRIGFEGDLIYYAKRSYTLKLLRPHNREALLTLANAGAWGTSPYAKAFEQVMADPAARLAFKELVVEATPPGKVYGLCGLYLTQSTAFPEARARLVRAGPSRVWIQSSDDSFDVSSTSALAFRPELTCQALAARRSHDRDHPAANGR